MVKFKYIRPINNGMAGIVTALETCYCIGFSCQIVYNLAFSLITPLGANYYNAIIFFHINDTLPLNLTPARYYNLTENRLNVLTGFRLSKF